MKNNEFKELVDRDLSGLVWDERKRRQVLYALNEEGKPVRKISTTFILVAAIACLSVTALAAGLIFAKRRRADGERRRRHIYRDRRAELRAGRIYRYDPER